MSDRPLSFVTVYHNVGDDSFSGYRPGDPLIRVFTYETPAVDDAVILGGAFEMFNIGASAVSRAYRARRLRSVSRGDCLMVDGRLYAVAMTEFDLVSPDEARFLTGEAAETAVRARYGISSGEKLTVTVPLPA